MAPVRFGSGIFDCNGVELKSTLSPPSTLLGDYLGSWLTKVEKFATRPSCSVIPISGQYLEQIDAVDDQLRRAQGLIRKWASSTLSLYDLIFLASPPPESSSDQSPFDSLSGTYFLDPRSGDRPDLDFCQLYQAFLNTFAPVHPVEHRPEPKEVSRLLKNLLRSVRSLRLLLCAVSVMSNEPSSDPCPGTAVWAGREECGSSCTVAIPRKHINFMSPRLRFLTGGDDGPATRN